MMPDPSDLPRGCKFHPRCPNCTDQCKTENPPVVEVEPGHKVKCWLAQEGRRTMSVLLEVNHLQKYFHTKSGTLHAVENVSFQLEEGKTLGVVGESGCGKSTLGRVILHLLPATGGKILFQGEDISKPSRQKAARAAAGYADGVPGPVFLHQPPA